MTVRRSRTKYAIDYSGFLKVPADGLFIYSAPGYNHHINRWQFDHIAIQK